MEVVYKVFLICFALGIHHNAGVGMFVLMY